MNNFAIITRDCHGFQYYKQNNIPYNVPTIGNCMRIPDFIKYVQHLNNLQDFKLSIINEIGLSYYVGIVQYKDCCIRIHFQHDKYKTISYDKWMRRSKRLQQHIIESKPLYIFLNDIDIKECVKPFWSYVNDLLSIEHDYKFIIFCSFKNIQDIQNNILDKILMKGVYVQLPDYVKNGPDIYKFVNDNNLFDNIITANTGKVFRL